MLCLIVIRMLQPFLVVKLIIIKAVKITHNHVSFLMISLFFDVAKFLIEAFMLIFIVQLIR